MDKLILLVTKVYAAGTESELAGSKNIGDYISALYAWVIPTSVALAGLVMIYAGFIYMTSQGNPDSTKQAKDLIIGALVGLGLIILAGVILKNVIGIPT